MKKIISLFLSAVMVATLLPSFAVSSFAAEKEIADFVALVSDIGEPTLGGSIFQPTFDFDTDYGDDYSAIVTSGAWYCKVDDEWTDEFDTVVFTEGEWKYVANIALEASSVAGYAFDDTTVAFVNEEEWTVSNVTEKTLTATSPEFSTHNWNSEFTIDTPATCTSKGSKSIHCLNDGCNKTKSVTSIAAIGHNFVHGICDNCGQKREGDCGDYTTWFFDNTDNVLTISGTGDMRLLGVDNTYKTEDMAALVTDVIIEDGVTSICANAFQDFKKLKSVTIASSVETIDAYAFSGCIALPSIVIPDSVTRIGMFAFNGCVALKGATLPDSVTSIGNNVFSGCSTLATVTLNEGITTIPMYAFQNCTSLTSIVIPNGVTYIQAYAFSGCTKLATVTVPATVTQIGYKAFGTCKALSSVKFLGCKEAYDKISYAASDIGGSLGIALGDGNEKFKNASTTYGDHNVTVTEITKQPTCAATGVKAHKCQYCGKTMSTDVLPATGKHTYKFYTTPATTDKAGETGDKCSVCGKVINKNTIAKISSVSISASKYVYDGKVKKPTVTVKDSSGNKLSTSYYTVTYSNNKSVGKATVTVKFSSRYSGTVTKNFTIVPKSTTISKLTGTKGGLKATWKKQATQTTGYQIQIATNSKFTKGTKLYTISKNSTVSKSITKLTKKKKYYVRIRTYKTVSGTKYYSSWSSSKYVTTKK